jgi:hypothetical protein
MPHAHRARILSTHVPSGIVKQLLKQRLDSILDLVAGVDLDLTRAAPDRLESGDSFTDCASP